jgi:hypothetical protein
MEEATRRGDKVTDRRGDKEGEAETRRANTDKARE